jgi:hypothetical protein
MFDLINNGREVNVIGTGEGTQAEAYDIDGQPFFDVPSTDCMAFYDDGQGEDDGEEEEDNEADPKDVAVDAMAMGKNSTAKGELDKEILYLHCYLCWLQIVFKQS